MKIVDVTRSLFADTIVYPGDTIPSYVQRDAGNYLISELHLSSHTGTHIDAPAHYLKKGETIDTVPLNNLMGKCRVLDVRSAGTVISRENLEGRIEGVSRLLLRTQFSGTNHFVEDYASVDVTVAQLISEKGLKCIGIDSPSIESFHCDGEVHREILGNGCSIIELLDLAAVDEGDYLMIALPLRLTGLDGSPARVLLVKDDEGELWTL